MRATAAMRPLAPSLLAVGLLCAISAEALPQGPPANSQNGGSQASATTRSVSLTSSFQLPDATPTKYQNASNIPATPIDDNPYLPDYAIKYAPVMYLDESEQYWPAAWDTHLSYVYPYMQYTPMTDVPNPLTLENLNFTTSYSLYLSMNDPAQQPRPDWLYAAYGQPNSTGYSKSNVTIIAVDKGESIGAGYVDCFYFFLYSFNLGDDVGGATYGNHVSDIEYMMVRFLNGEPKWVFYSQHQDGEAYAYSTVQKEDGRPVGYSAYGGHANYPVAGTFELVPGLIGLLEDKTTAGWRWDITQNYNGYWYSSVNGFVVAGGSNSSAGHDGGPPGIGYLQQTGKWGNKALPASNPAQQIIFGQEAWSDGGTGPIDPSKSLARTWLCVQSNCAVNASLPATSALQAGQQQVTTQSGAATPAQNLAALSLLLPLALAGYTLF